MLTRTSSDRRDSLRMLMAEMVYWFQYQCLSSQPFHSQDLISKSPYCLLHSSYDFSSKNFGIGSTNNSLLEVFLHYLSP